MLIDLEAALRTGRWGPVGPGSTRGEVEVQLGLPEAWVQGARTPGFRYAERWVYGGYEVVFGQDQRVRAVFCERLDALDEAVAFRVQPGLLRRGSVLTLEEVARGLHERGIESWVWRQRHTGAGVLTTAGGASLHFHGAEGELPAPTWRIAALVVDGRAVPDERLLDGSWSPPWASVGPMR